MAQNEMMFREYNERIQRGFDELKQLARQEGKTHLDYKDDSPLHFYCECSDERCNMRILLKPSAYAQIHERRQRFIVVKDHDVPQIERIIYGGSEYSVIEKKADLPSHPTQLQTTDIENV